MWFVVIGYAKLERHTARTATTWRSYEQTWTVKKVCVQLKFDHLFFSPFHSSCPYLWKLDQCNSSLLWKLDLSKLLLHSWTPNRGMISLRSVFMCIDEIITEILTIEEINNTRILLLEVSWNVKLCLLEVSSLKDAINK
jgi:hypothetical protein